MSTKWLDKLKLNSVILQYTSYIVLTLLLLDTIINRIFLFFARYSELSDFFTLDFVIRFGRYTFIFGDMAVIILLVLITIMIYRKNHISEQYIILPLLILIAANILRFVLRSTMELDILTTLLNISSIIILMLAVKSRIKKNELKTNIQKRIIPIYLIILIIILISQHIHQLNNIIFNSELITNSVIQNIVLYLFLIEAFVLSIYAISIYGKELPQKLLKPNGILVIASLIIVILGIISINFLRPQAIPEIINLVFGIAPQSIVNQFMIIGFIFFISSCGILWLDKGDTGLYRQEAVGLLIIAVSVFFFGSIYYYPRVAIGILLITIPLFKNNK